MGGFSAMANSELTRRIGAHAADMDLTGGPNPAHQKKLGDRVVILHMTLGQGNPHLSPKSMPNRNAKKLPLAPSCSAPR